MFMHLLFVLFVKIALGDSAIVRINNENEFIDFSKNVSSGMNYSGTTVYLDSHLSLSGETFEPIGKDNVNYFNGIFDGQGHIISDLKMNFPSQYTGLFGFSNWLTIRNVVLDSSCSITSSYGGSGDVYVGGIIGHCSTSNGECNIENSVNMADVIFSENTTGSSGYLYLGGIVGRVYSSSYVKNCANYGSVTQSGIVSRNSCIGGIAGALYGSSSSYAYLYNCLNYGTITHNGTSSGELRLGGIVGDNYYHMYIENCMNAGEISTPTKPQESYIGSIAGYVYSGSNITYCYCTNDAGIGSLYVYASSTPTVIEISDSPSTVNSTLITKLNNYAAKNNTWNKWLLNVNNASVSFIINYGKGVTVNLQIILLPDLANSSERNFSGWYADANLTTLFNLSQVDSNTTLYGMFCDYSNHTVTLDANGGNELGENEMTVGCMSYYGPFPENVTRTGHTLTGWFTERKGCDKVETGDKAKILSNHTLYAHWVINNYIVTFDFDNGTIVNKIFAYNTSIEYPKNEDMKREGYIFNGWDETVINMPAQNIIIAALWRANNYAVTLDVNGGNDLDSYTMTVTFNSSYGSLPTPTKEGHMFLGWFTGKNVSVKNETIVSIADNHTLHAHWEKITNQVEILFNTKDLSKEVIEDIVKKYTDAKFTISEFGEESGEIRVILKFIDVEEAVEFVRKINELSRDDDSNMIKRVGFVPDSDASFTPFLYPTLFLFLL